MTDCGCEKAKAELEEYLHRELSEQDFQDITEHLTQKYGSTPEQQAQIRQTIGDGNISPQMMELRL